MGESVYPHCPAESMDPSKRNPWGHVDGLRACLRREWSLRESHRIQTTARYLCELEQIPQDRPVCRGGETCALEELLARGNEYAQTHRESQYRTSR